MEIAKRTVLVTGASAGIGAATARTLSARGAQVLLVARRDEALRELAATLPGPARAYACDVGDPHAVTAMAASVLAEVGVPDIIVNNAGAGRWLWIEETSNEEFLAQVAVPFHAAFFVTRAFIQPMLERGSGWVVNVNSPISEAAWPGATGYGAARWGLRGFDECLAADLRGTGIGVTAVVAGRTDSDYFDVNPGALEKLPAMDRCFRRLSPDDVAAMIVRGLDREQRKVVEPLEIRLSSLAARLSPRGIAWFLGRTGASREVRTAERSRTP